MDRIDKKILSALQQNGALTNIELADAVGLSPSPCLRRVKQLKATGVIKNTVALLDTQRLGYQFKALVFIGLNSHASTHMKCFEASVANIPEVLECHLITGSDADYSLKVVAKDIEDYQRILLKKITCIEGVETVKSNFILKSPVSKTALPL